MTTTHLSGAAILASDELSSSITPIHYKMDDLTYDLGILTAYDNHPVDHQTLSSSTSSKSKEQILHKLATDNTQLLIKHIFELPTETLEGGPVATLPDRIIRLPRAKPIPRPKELTRWEKFAQAKGIQKKSKRDRMVWDEEAGEFRPRWGYKRVRDESETWALEYKPNDDLTKDLFEEQALKKKKRILQNEISHLSNQQRSSNHRNTTGGIESIIAKPHQLSSGTNKKGKHQRLNDNTNEHTATTLSSSKAIIGIAPIHHNEGNVNKLFDQGKQPRPKPSEQTLLPTKESKDIKQSRLKIAQVSTASMGKFDKQVTNEPARPKDPHKQKRLPNELSVTSEKSRQNDILKKVLHGDGEGESSNRYSSSSGAVKMDHRQSIKEESRTGFGKKSNKHQSGHGKGGRK